MPCIVESVLTWKSLSSTTTKERQERHLVDGFCLPSRALVLFLSLLLSTFPSSSSPSLYFYTCAFDFSIYYLLSRSLSALWLPSFIFSIRRLVSSCCCSAAKRTRRRSIRTRHCCFSLLTLNNDRMFPIIPFLFLFLFILRSHRPFIPLSLFLFPFLFYTVCILLM